MITKIFLKRTWLSFLTVAMSVWVVHLSNPQERGREWFYVILAGFAAGRSIGRIVDAVQHWYNMREEERRWSAKKSPNAS